jgi:hypothetical protein
MDCAPGKGALDYNAPDFGTEHHLAFARLRAGNAWGEGRESSPALSGEQPDVLLLNTTLTTPQRRLG